jgi:hypothetical protein
MAKKFYRYPPRPSSGAGTFSDNIVGLQIVDGGGLTQGNFEFTTSIVEKVNRNFNIGAFSEPISLDSLNIGSILESKAIIAKDFRVYPNFDLSEISRFTLYGPLSKRMSTSIQKIINFFPGAIEVSPNNYDSSTGNTVINSSYDITENQTTFDIQIEKIRNPFGVDFSVNATRNISLLDYVVSPLRNLTKEYSKYSVFIGSDEYPIAYLNPAISLYSGLLTITIVGNPFNNSVTSTDYLVVRPNSFYSDKSLLEPFDEVEKFLMNRLIVPQYTAVFKVPKQTEDGLLYTDNQTVTWPLNGVWNLDISTESFDFYLSTVSDIADSFDSFRTNLVTRFLTTQAFKDFDTQDQKVQKILNIYGRSFDEVKKFIDTLSFMNSVNYNVGNDIPSQLLKNLAETVGWKINVSPITNDSFLESVFGNQSKIQYPGYSRASTPTELNYQFYRNLILNSAHLFKSKGTRKSIEFMLRLVGAPEALVEFNENIYIAGQKINMGDFDRQYASISGGTYIEQLPVYDSGTTFSIHGITYTGFTNQKITKDANATLFDYPVDDDGYPKSLVETSGHFFQKGAGWFELVKDHQSIQAVNKTASVFTGQNFNIQTYFEPFTYGQKYLERFRTFPYMSEGFKIVRTVDNKKSWPVTDVGLRVGTSTSNYNAYYFVSTEKLVLNVKNVDLFMNPAQGLVYDVWSMSNKYDYPIPSTGLTSPYPQPGGVDWTFINPKPSKKTFFEFAQTFWSNMINTRNRQFISDGKTGGYPTLQSIWWKYQQSQSAVNIPNDNFNYQSMINYINGLGDYWVRLVEQMIPATTIWMAGTKFENSIFHRQKFVYRLQRGCEIVPLPCDPCVINGNIFPYNCSDETVNCYVYPWDNGQTTVTSFGDVLYQTINSYLTSQGKTFSDCPEQSIIADWFIDVKLGGNQILKLQFYHGLGISDVPSNTLWLSEITTYLPPILLENGLGFSVDTTGSSPKFVVYNLGCDPNFRDKTFELNVGINFSINCN